jgi:hypothetical protein
MATSTIAHSVGLNNSPGGSTPGSNQYFNGMPSIPAGNTPGAYTGSMMNMGSPQNPWGTGPNPWGFSGPTYGPGSGVPGVYNTQPGQQTNPFQVPGYPTPESYPWGTADPNMGGWAPGAAHSGFTTNPGSENLGHGIIATGLQYGGLSQDFANYLMSQIGSGIQPFNLSTMLPTGGMTAPGQLTAGMNPLLSQLANFFQTGQGGGAGAQTLQSIAQNGVNAVPAWQQMVNAQQQGIQQNLASLQESMGATGNVAGSGDSTALSNYLTQTSADQNALLGQLQLQGITQAQLPAAQALLGGSTQMASGLQNLDQSAIDNMLQQYMQTLPQNNPMLPYIQNLATLYPPTTKTPTSYDQFLGTLQSLQGAGFSSTPGGGTSVAY